MDANDWNLVYDIKETESVYTTGNIAPVTLIIKDNTLTHEVVFNNIGKKVKDYGLEIGVHIKFADMEVEGVMTAINDESKDIRNCSIIVTKIISRFIDDRLYAFITFIASLFVYRYITIDPFKYTSS